MNDLWSGLKTFAKLEHAASLIGRTRQIVL